MKNILALILLLLTAVPVTLRAGNKNKTRFEGVWQMSYVARHGEKSTVRYIPIWKTFTSDGRFNIMMWRGDDIATFISTTGSYKVKNDSTAIENVEHSATNPELKGTQTLVKYQFIEPDMLFIRYRLKGSSNEGQELWTRVRAVSQASQFPLSSSRRERRRNDVVLDTTGVYLSTEQMPEFPNGGHDGLMKYMAENLSYPVEAMERGLEGVVVLRFIVNEEGRTEDFRIIKSASPLLDQEAIRTLKEAHFCPGRHNGRPVKVYYTVPVTFKLK